MIVPLNLDVYKVVLQLSQEPLVVVKLSFLNPYQNTRIQM